MKLPFDPDWQTRLADVTIPSGNRFEMLREMGMVPNLAAIPFIFLTTAAGVEDRIHGLPDGADDFITKPLDLDRHILVPIQRWLQ